MHSTKSDRLAFRADWAARGFSCEVWIDPPDQVWQDFEHDVDQIVLLLEGTCQIEMLGRTVRLQPGDELLIPAGTRHTVRNCGDGAARWLRGYRTMDANAPDL
jgi:mannose-6-phosphate isomerase-like protein (cupin superfamily)